MKLRYKLVGTQISRSLSIEKNDDDEGVIKTQVDNAFDFEKLSIVNVQILATEVNTEEHHTGTAELTINVIDVNDETPRISIVSKNKGVIQLKSICIYFI